MMSLTCGQCPAFVPLPIPPSEGGVTGRCSNNDGALVVSDQEACVKKEDEDEEVL